MSRDKDSEDMIDSAFDLGSDVFKQAAQLKDIKDIAMKANKKVYQQNNQEKEGYTPPGFMTAKAPIQASPDDTPVDPPPTSSVVKDTSGHATRTSSKKSADTPVKATKKHTKTPVKAAPKKATPKKATSSDHDVHALSRTAVTLTPSTHRAIKELCTFHRRHHRDSEARLSASELVRPLLDAHIEALRALKKPSREDILTWLEGVSGTNPGLEHEEGSPVRIDMYLTEATWNALMDVADMHNLHHMEDPSLSASELVRFILDAHIEALKALKKPSREDFQTYTDNLAV